LTLYPVSMFVALFGNSSARPNLDPVRTIAPVQVAAVLHRPQTSMTLVPTFSFSGNQCSNPAVRLSAQFMPIAPPSATTESFVARMPNKSRQPYR